MDGEILEDALRRVPLQDVTVRVEGRPRHWVAEISSPDFTKYDESERQRIVWEHLQRELSDDQRVQVEFIFILSPDE